MIQNQKLFFLSLIGIVVVSTLMVSTYAYQSMRVTYEDGSQNTLTVEAGKLDVTYTNTNKVDIKNLPLQKNYKSSEYIEFEVNNSRSSDDIDYQIQLDDLTKSDNVIDEDVRYTIVEVYNNKEFLLGGGNFVDLSNNNWILKFNLGNYDCIGKGQSKKLRLYIWIMETDDNQNHLENLSIQSKISVISYFSGEVTDITFAYQIYKNGADVLKSNGDVINKKVSMSNPDFSKVADGTDENEIGMFSMEDDYGMSYYFRGPVKNNYVNFAGMCWRIVRIEGDGAIRMTLASEKGLCDEENKLDDQSAFITNSDVLITQYGGSEEGVFQFINGGTFSACEGMVSCNNYLDSISFLGIGSDNIPKLKSTKVCIGANNQFNIEKEPEMCSGSDDYYDTENWYNIINNKPQLKCYENYSNKNAFLLTAEEVKMAGRLGYLRENAENNWWTSSSSGMGEMGGCMQQYIYVDSNGYLSEDGGAFTYAIRPSITLLNTSSVSGTGLQGDPYIVQ